MTSLSISEDSIPDLSGKTAIVTGGSSGIGLRTVEVLIDHNARVFILDIQPPPDRIESPNVTFIPTDITSWQDLVKTFSATTMTHNSRVDIAMANAGVGEHGTYPDDCITPAPTDAEGWADLESQEHSSYKTLDVNLIGTLNFVMLAARVMKGQRDGGSIVLTTSTTAYLPEQSLPVYCTSKGAVTNLIRTLRTTLPGHSIAISGVAHSATYSASLPQHMAAPILAAQLLVSTARHVGLAMVYSATAKQSRRVENYGKDDDNAVISERWNGRVIHTIGDTFTEVEDMLIQTRPQWWTQRDVDLARSQQKLTDLR